MIKRKAFTPLLICAALCVAALGPLCAQGLSEEELKARVVLRALLFFDWPSDSLAPGQPLLFCLLAPGPFAAALERLGGEIVNGRRLEIRRSPQGAAGANGCHISYVGASDAAALGPRGAPNLLLGDAPGLLERGAMLNVQVDQNRVVFDINLAAARRAGVDVNARLLRLARYVRQEL